LALARRPQHGGAADLDELSGDRRRDLAEEDVACGKDAVARPVYGAIVLRGREELEIVVGAELAHMGLDLARELVFGHAGAREFERPLPALLGDLGALLDASERPIVADLGDVADQPLRRDRRRAEDRRPSLADRARLDAAGDPDPLTAQLALLDRSL